MEERVGGSGGADREEASCVRAHRMLLQPSRVPRGDPFVEQTTLHVRRDPQSNPSIANSCTTRRYHTILQHRQQRPPTSAHHERQQTITTQSSYLRAAATEGDMTARSLKPISVNCRSEYPCDRRSLT